MKYLQNFALTTLDSGEVQGILDPIFQIMTIVVPILLTLVGSVGTLWCIALGVKYAKAEDPQEHEKAKKALVNAIVGFVLIFVLLIMLKVAVPVFKDFYTSYPA